jgi:hypothetical protein
MGLISRLLETFSFSFYFNFPANIANHRRLKAERGTSGAFSRPGAFALLGELLFGNFRYVPPLETGNY